ncbi:BQ2448_2324 [Microbotryum intermedium]|uniref:Ubiquitin carboxyl-terminal hydrolase n=1 Tax=Microbotryum intermedium TaxID=269621 RepID=A0A238FBM4_9BASI|nr:BQ2448_2324 [Microbotryum intermedium]
MELPDALLDSLRKPRPSQTVYREECTLCFDTYDGPVGIDVCLHCFNGACPVESTNRHGILHARKTGHKLHVNIRRIKKSTLISKRDSLEPPLKKLAVPEDVAEHDQYDIVSSVRSYAGEEAVQVRADHRLEPIVSAVLGSMSSATRSVVKSWEEEVVPCAHTSHLVQFPARELQRSGLATCEAAGCGLTSNLWLCLTCGSLGCGRPQFGGGGGNGHGLAHTKNHGHPVAVKMGTIEADGSADVYCYACDDARIDPQLAEHLANVGIAVHDQTKTEKSMTELQVEHNMSYDFAMTGADGAELEPLYGPGLTGMRNLGNSCYLASSLQTLFSLPSFQTRYLTSFHTHVMHCAHLDPTKCLECQLSKLADGLLSGRYAVPCQDDSTDTSLKSKDSQDFSKKKAPVFQAGISPSMFKALIGKGHSEFSTMRQQDAGEFLAYLLESMRRASRSTDLDDPTSTFRFAMEEKLQCLDCKGVRYTTTKEEVLSLPVPIVPRKQTGDDRLEVPTDAYEPAEFSKCLQEMVSPTDVDYACPTCNKKVLATNSMILLSRETHFTSFPNVLLVYAARFQFDNWVPRKVSVPLVVPFEPILLDSFQGKGLQSHETELPDLIQDTINYVPTYNTEAMGQLAAMGFAENRCKRALLATGNADANLAMEWLFAHMDDPDVDLPIEHAPTSSTPSHEELAPLVEMGFTASQATKALHETGNDATRAIEWLFSHPEEPEADGTSGGTEDLVTKPNHPEVIGSTMLPARYQLKAFISHKGPSVHSGHYVAHVRESSDAGWVLFNDEKVVRADKGFQSAELLAPLAYIYIFERV